MKLKNKVLLWSLFPTLIGCIDDGSSSSNNNSGVTITITSEIIDSEESLNAYVYIYNEDKKLTQVSFDRELDGQIDKEEIYKYHEDGKGESTSIYVIEDGNRVLSELIEYQYTETNNYTVRSSDKDLDGVFDEIKTTVYEVNYRIVEVRYDNNADGIIDRVDEWGGSTPEVEKDIAYYNDIASSSTSYYNANDDWIGYSWDRDGDGVADTIFDVDYNESGLKESDSWDDDADGTYERVTTYEYDDQDKLSREVFFHKDDPVTAYEHSKVYTYKDDLITKITETYLSGDVNVQNFNDDGYISSYIREDDGLVKRKYNYTYSGDLSLLEYMYIPTYFSWN